MANKLIWSGSGVTAYAKNTAYTAGDRVVPAVADTGANHLIAKRFVWECTTSGTTDVTNYPTWNASYTADSDTEASGTAVFTCRNPGYSSGSTINWTFAGPYLAYCISTIVTSAANVVWVHKTHQEEVTATAAFAFLTPIISVDKDASNAPSPMGIGGWLGSSGATSYGIDIDSCPYMYGVTIRVAANATNVNLGVGPRGDGAESVFDECYFWQGSTNASALIKVAWFQDAQIAARCLNCTFRFGNVAQQFVMSSKVFIDGGSISSSGSALTSAVFRIAAGADPGGATLRVEGFDLSACGVCTLVSSNVAAAADVHLVRCKFPGSYTTLAAATFWTNRSEVDVYVNDCSSGTVEKIFGHFNNLGSTVSTADDVIYRTAGAAARGWKITTTSAASFLNPYFTPWIDFYNTTLTAVTPYIGGLRDGSTTPYTKAQVWAEYTYKQTSGSDKSTFVNDRQTLAAYLAGTTADDNDADGVYTDWTGSTSADDVIKMTSGGAITCAEAGHIRGRICVGLASLAGVLYIDPQIRT
jgi:hypothetical protein